MQQAEAKAIIATYGWCHKIDRRPLEQGGTSERLYVTKMVHICNVALLPKLQRDDLVARLQVNAIPHPAERIRAGSEPFPQEEIEKAIVVTTEQLAECGWKAFLHHVGKQTYVCAQKVQYLTTVERLEDMSEAQFHRLLQRKVGSKHVFTSPRGGAEIVNNPAHIATNQRAFPVLPSVASVLARAFNPQPALPPPVTVPLGTVCAQSGVPLMEGIALSDVLSLYSSELAETFPYVDSIQTAAPVRVSTYEPHRGPHRRPSGRKKRLGHASRYVSVDVAQVYASRFSGNLLTIDGRGLRPLVTDAFATEERPRWRDLLLHSLTAGMQTVAIMSHEAQRRLWPRAAVSFVGPNWAVLLNDEYGCRLLRVNFAQVLDCLHLIEQVYALGFSKAHIRDGLLTYAAHALIASVGVEKVRAFDLALSQIRATPAFPIALFVAQREEILHD